MSARFSVETVFKALDRFSAPISKMQNRIGRLTRKMKRGFEGVDRVVKKVSSGIKKGAMVATAALGAVAFAARDVIKTGAEFGRAIGSAAAKFPDKIKRGTKEFLALQQVAREVGASTEYTATEAAKGLNFMAKAGYSAELAMRALPDIVNFATASETDFAIAADIATDAVGAFGLKGATTAEKVANLNRVMDVMSLTANSTNVNVEQLFETIKKGAPIAIKAGQSVETFSAIAGVLAGAGIKESVAGTATKNIALALAGVGNQAGKTFKKLNIPLAINGKMRDVADVFEDLSNATKNLPEDKVLAVMNAIFGKISLASAANLLGDGAESIRKLRGELEKAGGSSKRTAEFIRNDVQGSLDSLNSAIDNVKISLFSASEGPLKRVIDRMTDWVRANEALITSKINGWIETLINNFSEIVKWTKRIAIALGVFVAFIAILKTLIVVMTAVNILMALNPVVLITLGVIALVVAVGALIKYWGRFSAAMKIATAGILSAMGPVGQIILAAARIKDKWEPIKELFSSIGDAFVKMSGIIDGPSKFFQNAGGWLADKTGAGSQGEYSPQVVSPQERIARTIEEKLTRNTSEITIKDNTGRAEITRGKPGAGIKLQPSGAF